MVLMVLVDNVASRRSHLFLELAKDVACVVTSSLALNVVPATSQKILERSQIRSHRESTQHNIFVFVPLVKLNSTRTESIVAEWSFHQ